MCIINVLKQWTINKEKQIIMEGGEVKEFSLYTPLKVHETY